MRVYPKWKLGAPSLYISPLTLAVSKLRLRLHGEIHKTPSPMAILGGMGANYCTPPVRLQYSGSLWVRTHYMPKHVPTYRLALCGGVF